MEPSLLRILGLNELEEASRATCGPSDNWLRSDVSVACIMCKRRMKDGTNSRNQICFQFCGMTARIATVQQEVDDPG
jgi:hypothetical protein